MRLTPLFLDKVRVRFAPSPTGHLHIGGLRTAFFNYLFAKKHGGDFILRIEDTDQARYVDGAQEKIYDALHAYRLQPDEGPREGGSFGPYEQSKRLHHYESAARQLVETGQAYRCFCTEERLGLLRKDAAKRGDVPKYDRKCMHLDGETAKSMEDNGEKFVIRFKLDKQVVNFQDEVFGSVSQCIDESDPVLLKSDGFPTYHLANVVDDRHMEISHVIRGMEWLSSTGKHQILYKSFNWTPPKFVHLSLIMRTATKKLSKRDKDAFVAYYGDELGILPEAVLNLMIRNGSGIQNFDADHFYSLHEMIDRFDLSLLGRRNLLLDSDVLEKYARMAFQSSDFEAVLYPLIIDRLKRDCPGVQIPDKNYTRTVVEFLKSKEEKFGFLSSLTRGDFSWFFSRPESSDFLRISYPTFDLKAILNELLALKTLKPESLAGVAKRHRLQMPKLMGIIRVSLIGTKNGPPISELFEFFGLEECQKRMELMASLLQKS
uniref:Nondiscriminating glutamyl-tRNA synthetase EARS2, mitochondrial n=1 Tax=Caenorhabditis japonica TaxID=281687 RepID=A0A8R1DPQ7_CAEJA